MKLANYFAVSAGFAALLGCAKVNPYGFATAHQQLSQAKLLPNASLSRLGSIHGHRPNSSGGPAATQAATPIAPAPTTMDPSTTSGEPPAAPASDPSSGPGISVPVSTMCSNRMAEQSPTFVQTTQFEAKLYAAVSSSSDWFDDSNYTRGQEYPVTLPADFKSGVMNTKTATFQVGNLPDGDYILSLKSMTQGGSIAPLPDPDPENFNLIHINNGQPSIQSSTGSHHRSHSNSGVWLLYDRNPDHLDFGGNIGQPGSLGSPGTPSGRFSAGPRLFGGSTPFTFLAEAPTPPAPTFGPPPSTITGDPNAAGPQPGQTPVVCGTDPNSPVDPLECPLPPVPVTAPPTPPQSVNPPSVSPPSAPPASAPPASSPPTCDQTRSPLVIDTKSQAAQASIALSAPTDGVWFNIGGEYDRFGRSIERLISWMENPSKDKLLALPNADGKIVDINQLFGNNTVGPDGKKARNGFEALTKYDSNGDGVIDQNDPIFRKLRLWADLNGDGKADANELTSLDEEGIAAIDLNADMIYERDIYGNETRQRSVVMTRAGARAIFDIWFRPVQSREMWRGR